MEKVRTAREIGAPENPEVIKEVFRASIGFDFVFTKGDNGNRKIFCIEINGHDSGITGVQNIPRGQIDDMSKIMTDIRSKINRKRDEKYEKITELERLYSTGDMELLDNPRVRDYIIESFNSTPFYEYSYTNPDYIEDIAENKKKQADIIPDHLQPRIWRPSGSAVSPSGYWILKPIHNRAGRGIIIYSNEEFREFLHHTPSSVLKMFKGEYVIQELIEVMPADKDPHGGVSSLRLLLDFRYSEEDEILIDYASIYQRVGKKTNENEDSQSQRKGKYVINKSTGAKSVAASKEEQDMAYKAAKEIIRSLAQAYKNQISHTK